MSDIDANPDPDPPTPADPAPTDPVAAAEARVAAYVHGMGLKSEPGSRDGEIVISLPGEKKLTTVVSLLLRPRAVSVSAFVIRNPDENHENFYRNLLRRNLRLTGIAYAIDGDGDVFVRGEVPTEALDADHLDQLFGVILAASDDAFNELLTLGFLESMKKEWAWRISRGESTRNLAAFKPLLEQATGILEPRD